MSVSAGPAALAVHDMVWLLEGAALKDPLALRPRFASFSSIIIMFTLALAAGAMPTLVKAPPDLAHDMPPPDGTRGKSPLGGEDAPAGDDALVVALLLLTVFVLRDETGVAVAARPEPAAPPGVAARRLAVEDDETVLTMERNCVPIAPPLLLLPERFRAIGTHVGDELPEAEPATPPVELPTVHALSGAGREDAARAACCGCTGSGSGQSKTMRSASSESSAAFL